MLTLSPQSQTPLVLQIVTGFRTAIEDGPLRPLRINGRLAWPVAEIRRITRAEGSANV